jgi:FKBP-type peptidyl-prolyl cis-trans isomerase FkpA
MRHRVDIEADEPGSGDVAERGMTVVVEVEGRLRRGDVFLERQLCTFTLGAREVIAGLEYGVEGMRVGGRRRICVPPHLAYRDQGIAGAVPPNALLFFDMQLLEIKDGLP